MIVSRSTQPTLPPLPQNDNSVVETSRQTACYTNTYWGLFPLALFCLFLYPIGVPFFCGFLLKTKRVKLGVSSSGGAASLYV